MEEVLAWLRSLGIATSANASDSKECPICTEILPRTNSAYMQHYREHLFESKGCHVDVGKASKVRVQDTVIVEDVENDSPCSICLKEFCTIENPIIFCDGQCKEGYHKLCFGLQQIPAEDWYCSAQCAYQRDIVPPRRKKKNGRKKGGTSRKSSPDIQEDDDMQQVTEFFEQIEPFFEPLSKTDIAKQLGFSSARNNTWFYSNAWDVPLLGEHYRGAWEEEDYQREMNHPRNKRRLEREAAMLKTQGRNRSPQKAREETQKSSRDARAADRREAFEVLDDGYPKKRNAFTHEVCVCDILKSNENMEMAASQVSSMQPSTFSMRSVEYGDAVDQKLIPETGFDIEAHLFGFENVDKYKKESKDSDSEEEEKESSDTPTRTSFCAILTKNPNEEKKSEIIQTTNVPSLEGFRIFSPPLCYHWDTQTYTDIAVLEDPNVIDKNLTLDILPQKQDISEDIQDTEEADEVCSELWLLRQELKRQCVMNMQRKGKLRTTMEHEEDRDSMFKRKRQHERTILFYNRMYRPESVSHMDIKTLHTTKDEELLVEEIEKAKTKRLIKALLGHMTMKVEKRGGKDSIAIKKQVIQEKTHVLPHNTNLLASDASLTVKNTMNWMLRQVEKQEHEWQAKSAEQQTFCICQTPYTASMFYIQCDICQEWYHGQCVDVSSELGETIDMYVCLDCHKDTGKETKFMPLLADTPRSTRFSGNYANLLNDINGVQQSKTWNSLKICLKKTQLYVGKGIMDFYSFGCTKKDGEVVEISKNPPIFRRQRQKRTNKSHNGRLRVLANNVIKMKKTLVPRFESWKMPEVYPSTDIPKPGVTVKKSRATFVFTSAPKEKQQQHEESSEELSQGERKVVTRNSLRSKEPEKIIRRNTRKNRNNLVLTYDGDSEDDEESYSEEEDIESSTSSSSASISYFSSSSSSSEEDDYRRSTKFQTEQPIHQHRGLVRYTYRPRDSAPKIERLTGRKHRIEIVLKNRGKNHRTFVSPVHTRRKRGLNEVQYTPNKQSTATKPKRRKRSGYY